MKKLLRKTSAFDIVVTLIFIVVCIIMLYPFWYATVYSLSNASKIYQSGSVALWPKGFTLINYKTIFNDERFASAGIISVARTVVGTLIFLFVTGFAAYSMSKKRLLGRKWIFLFLAIPMYVTGGMIPGYINIRNLGLMNNFWVYVLPFCYATYYMLIMKVFLEGIPESLEESAMIDGASDFKILLSIYIPLAVPVIATLAVFQGVMLWNEWMSALLYVSNKDLHPLQKVLQQILAETQMNSLDEIFMQGTKAEKESISPETYKMAALLVTTLPIIFIYPFAQKYFVKGMTLGAVKL